MSTNPDNVGGLPEPMGFQESYRVWNNADGKNGYLPSFMDRVEALLAARDKQWVELCRAAPAGGDAGVQTVPGVEYVDSQRLEWLGNHIDGHVGIRILDGRSYINADSADDLRYGIDEAMRQDSWAEKCRLGEFDSPERKLAARGTPGIDRLWDTQWANIVNHDACYFGYTVEEAVNTAVKLTEHKMAENFKAAALDSAPAGSGEVEDIAASLEQMTDLLWWLNGQPLDEECAVVLREAAALLRKLQQGADTWIAPKRASEAMIDWMVLQYDGGSGPARWMMQQLYQAARRAASQSQEGNSNAPD